MAAISNSAIRRPAILLTMWVLLLFVGVIFSTFLHEDGHGFGAKLDGVRISTGFMKVGNYGKSPDDPDFRTGGTENAIWSGLLGPITSWLLAITLTVWLHRFKKPSWSALTVGALAVSNALIRLVPMLLFLIAALLGRPYLEDEVAWGVWYILKFSRPELADLTLGYHAIVKTYASTLLSEPAFWIPPLLSLAISLACLILALRRIYKLWREGLYIRINPLLFGLLPLVPYFATLPVLNLLDRLIRINW